MYWFDHALVILFTVLLPFHGWRQYPLFVELVKRNPKVVRRSVYISNIIMLWSLAIAVIVIWIYAQRTYNELGLTSLRGDSAVVSLVVVIVLIAMVIQYYKALLQSERKHHWVFVPELLPRTNSELKLFLYLSATAGITEELLFRGYLMWYLSHYGNIGFTILVSSFLFTLAHAYQGFRATLVIFPVALVLCLLYVYSNSLLVPMLLHAAMNSYAGVFGKKLFSDSA